MTARITRLSVAVVAVIAWALWLGVLTGRGELFVVVVPLAIAVARAGRHRAPRYSLTHEVTTARVFEGDAATVTITVTAGSPVAQLELLEPLPPAVTLIAGSNRAVLALDAGETVRWSYDVRFAARARVTLGGVHARIWDPSGLETRDARHDHPTTIRVYPRPVPLRLLPDPLRTRASIGNYVSAVVGEGLEPGEIRPFAPGDRIKHVNWRTSLRLGELHVSRQQEERNADVVLMLDSLSQAGVGTTTTLNACVRAAASLAAAYLARKDRVGLVEYGGILRWVRPASGRLQLEQLLDTLLRADVMFTYVTRQVGLVPPRVLPPQALVIALSPLLDPRFLTAMSDLAARRFDLVVIAVNPIAVTRASLTPSTLVDGAAALASLKRGLQLDDLRRRGLRVMDWNPDDPIDLALARLERRARAVAG
jgi:uncharacterized protein (DUF58 family)